MQWREPDFLWLSGLVVLLGAVLALALRGRVRALERFVDADLGRRLAVGSSAARRIACVALRLAALLLVVVALAGPKWGFHWEEVRREGIDLLVALDTSRSMLATDVKPNRLERAKLAVLDLLPRLRGDRIGLVAYAGTAFLEAPLTLDYAAFARSLRALQVGIIPRGGTSLSRAIETSLEAFEARQGKYEALILITDGEDHEGDALDAATLAAERGVRIYTVGIGTPEGELLPLPGATAGYVKDRKGQVVKSRLNEELLRDIALDTGGAYVRGLGPQLGLDEVFDQHIAKMERREVDSGLERRFEHRFQLPLLLALVLLLVEALIGERPGRARGWLARLSRNRAAASASILWLAVAFAEPVPAGLLDFEDHPINQGVEAFERGDYEAAVETFGDALVESPADPQLQFDLGAALYKQGRYEEAIATLEKAATEGGEKWAAPANYNLGNAYYRAGAETEGEQPQQTLERWAQALLAYRRALAVDPADEDAQFNHELVQKRIDELRQRLEDEQQEEQEQEQQPDGDQQQEQEEQSDGEQEEGEEQQESEQGEQERQQEQGEQEQGEQQQDDSQQPDSEAGEEQPQPEESEAGEQDEEAADDAAEQQPQDEQPADEPQQEEQPAAQGGGEATASDEERAAEEQAAQAVLDTAREEELGPQDIERRTGVAGVGDPMQDW